MGPRATPAVILWNLCGWLASHAPQRRPQGGTVTPCHAVSRGRPGVLTVAAWMQDGGLAVLQPALSSMTALRSLDISANEASDAGTPRLAASLAPLATLRKLDCSYQPLLAGPGAGSFAAALRQLSALQSLLVISVGLDGSGVAALARALPQSLTSLHLSHNPIGADGAAALFDAVAGRPALSHVSVGYADLGPRAAAACGSALERATQLQFLDLRYNALRAHGAVDLLPHLKALTGLRSVVLEGNGVDASRSDVRLVQHELKGVRVWLNVGARIA